MKKIGLFLILISLNNCAFNPIVDTSGRSGTFDKSQAVELTNDLQHCQTLAKENTSKLIESSKYIYNYYLRASVLWLSPKANYNYPKLYRSCLQGRGHSVLN